ncbi:MAG: Sb-PDE family phosphodiesterase [Bacteroidales bacterium]
MQTQFLRILILQFVVLGLANAQNNFRNEFILPDLPGYQTLRCDFHMHTAFSDGSVWPDFRVREAWRQGLDAIAITDHIEYLPHKKDIRTNHNRSYELAQSQARQLDIILIKGSEITRKMPPGHLNALFITNSQPLDTPDWKDAVKIAASQGAYIFWNHPGWKAQQPDTMKWFEEHSWLLSQGYLKGIEVINSQEWYPGALRWALDRNLTILANSDSHDPVDFEYNRLRRPMTLVFAKEKSEQGIREALESHRTAGFYNDTLLGRKEILEAFFLASVEFTRNTYKPGGKRIVVQLSNKSSIPYSINLVSCNPGIRPARFIYLPALKTVTWEMGYDEKVFTGKDLDMQVRVSNLFTSEGQNLVTSLSFRLE